MECLIWVLWSMHTCRQEHRRFLHIGTKMKFFPFEQGLLGKASIGHVGSEPS
jgi:hypothetical protein